MRQLNFSILARLDARIGCRPKVSAIVAAAIVMVACASSAFQPEIYSTGPGEWRTITFSDGSVARLGPKTTIEVRYAQKERWIEQGRCEGEATYQVAKDSARPFYVECGVTTVQAIGTKFGVSSVAQVTKVTVAEGVVAVSRRPISRDQAAMHNNVRAEAGQQVIIDLAKPLAARPVNVDDELSWEHARIFFHGVPVEEAISEYNRRHEAQIPFPTYTSANFRVFGRFQLDDPAQFVRFMEQNLAQQRARQRAK